MVRFGSTAINDRRQSVDPSSSALIEETLKKCFSTLLSESKAIVSNKEKIDEDTIGKWREDIEALSARVARANYARSIVAETVSAALEDREKNTSSTQMGDDELKKTIKQRVADKVDGYDTGKDRNVLKIVCAVRGEEEEMEGDFAIVEKEFTLADAKCPVLLRICEEPMKHSGCPHRISKQGLESLMQRKQSVPCPLPGCTALWRRGGATLDTEFQEKIRVARLTAEQAEQDGEGGGTGGASTSASSSSSSSKHGTKRRTMAIDDEEDEEGYTQL